MQNNPNLQPPPTDPLQQPTYLSQPPTQPQASPMHATRISAPHGRPRVGCPISDFYGKYSTPHNQDAAGGETWIISPSPDATLVGTDADANDIVTRVTSVGSISWSQAQTESYCNHFLPTDASEFNRGCHIDFCVMMCSEKALKPGLD